MWSKVSDLLKVSNKYIWQVSSVSKVIPKFNALYQLSNKDLHIQVNYKKVERAVNYKLSLSHNIYNINP